jgi:hypothetical protein
MFRFSVLIGIEYQRIFPPLLNWILRLCRLDNRLVILLALVLLLLFRTAESQHASPVQIVNGFCKLDASGRQLRSQNRKDSAPLFLDARAWSPNSEVLVIRDYSLHDLGAGRDSPEVGVLYRVVGRFDSALRFTHLQAPYSNQPLLVSEKISLILSDTLLIDNLNCWPHRKFQAADSLRQLESASSRASRKKCVTGSTHEETQDWRGL